MVGTYDSNSQEIRRQIYNVLGLGAPEEEVGRILKKDVLLGNHLAITFNSDSLFGPYQLASGLIVYNQLNNEMPADLPSITKDIRQNVLEELKRKPDYQIYTDFQGMCGTHPEIGTSFRGLTYELKTRFMGDCVPKCRRTGLEIFHMLEESKK
ncbi:MAG: hypothetical protein JW727_05685 [Candidatus Aenigmarchaeota archaeon]|nr:hypothetical protein [Candidatus Aenigmarchaeota archaeon]